MPRLLRTITLVIAGGLLLVACGGGSDDGEAEASTTTSRPTTTEPSAEAFCANLEKVRSAAVKTPIDQVTTPADVEAYKAEVTKFADTMHTALASAPAPIDDEAAAADSLLDQIMERFDAADTPEALSKEVQSLLELIVFEFDPGKRISEPIQDFVVENCTESARTTSTTGG